MPRHLAVAALSALAFVNVGAEQARPDFSGRWELDAARSDGLRDDERQGTTLAIIQTPARLVIERTLLGGQTRTVVYTFDGTESVSQAGDVAIKARSRWDGDRLVTEGTQGVSTLEAQFTERRSLSADGRTMTVESTFVLGKDRTTRIAVFIRSRG
jgi:hypothetical protein